MNNSSNPYEVPRSEGLEVHHLESDVVDSDKTVTAKFLFSFEHCAESMDRHFQQAPAQTVWKWIRWTAATVILFVAIVGTIGAIFAGPPWFHILLILIPYFLAFVGYYPRPFNRYFALRKIRKSPDLGLDQEFQFSSKFVYMKSSLGESRFLWEAFHSVSILNDGILIFQNAQLFYWIPDRTIETAEGPRILRQLCRQKLETRQCR